MKHLFRIFLPLIVIIIFVNLYFANDGKIRPIDNYPIWMKDLSGKQTDQTSGLFFVGADEGRKIFISADDIGKINRLSVDETKNPPEIYIYEVHFSDSVQVLFNKFKKTDMEDIFYDKSNNKIYLSIEGHEYSSKDPQIYRQKEGIYEITFNKDILTFDTLLTIKRLRLPLEVYMYTFDNIGFEGFSATENYFFLGLENLQTEGSQFTDNTMLYIVNRKTNELITIGTQNLHISTICGLYAVDDYNLYGIDRNRRSMFYINFNPDFSVNKISMKEIDLCIPRHYEINDVLGLAAESITFDNDGNIYVAEDPWKDFYKPNPTDKKKFSNEELQNFNTLVPIMYKFKNEF